MHQEFESPEELADTIKCFWYDRRESGNLPSDFEVVPDGYAEIIFYFGELGKKSGRGVDQPLPSPFIMGLQNHPIVFSTKGRLEIIAARCYPWTVYDLLGLPSCKNGVQTFEHPITQLQVSLSKSVHAGNIEEAITLLKKYFLNARSAVAVDTLLFKAGVAMSAANGTLPVSEVAAAAHATVRTLERKFKQSSGYTVKDVSGLMRFEQARNQLWSNPDVNLAALAHELGYTDQSHLTREFKRYTSMTPAAFARKAKKGKALAGDDFIAFTQI